MDAAMWAAASGPGFDPTAALTQQFSDLGFHEQAAPPPQQQIASQQAPAQAPDPAPAHITEFASERAGYSVQPALYGVAQASGCQSPAAFYSRPNPWKPPPTRPKRASLWLRKGKRVYASDEKGLPSDSEFEPPPTSPVTGWDPYGEPEFSTVHLEEEEVRLGSGAPPKPSHSLLMACPYLKYDPSKYSQRRGCRGAAFPTTHRLKEHLHRTHRQKPNCPRCRSIFKTEAEVGVHLKAKALCDVIQGEGQVEGFDAAQEKLLKSKKRRKGVKTEEDKWREIFIILFPNHKDVPDPFYKTPVNDQTATDQTPKREQDDVESIFTRDIPSPVEEEMSSKLEEAVGGRLTKKKRRKLLNVFRGFAVEMLRQSAERDIKNRAITLPSKSSQIEKSSGTARSARAPSEKLLRTVADDKPHEMLEGKQDEVYHLNEATQIGVPPTDPVMALSSLQSVEVTEPRGIPWDFQGFGLEMDSDIACWSAWDAVFANDDGDAWLNDILSTGTALPGGLAQAQGKTVEVEPMNAYDGVSTIPTQVQHVVGRDDAS
ncbi:uncharacterized protein BDZ83DRAFT_611184 [Colletotrichum acutatum]|uniref:C2H2-type domain-containing protein n=1 Tax=Glomerella acutata TaxID=27357 RepID=A0AAD8XHV9_GLOAC|nr:uncharacterized protein BDZ83DRAFT_611184 [Colletotrichum acutatum]KAK1727827.1 hypothetical protein BDZ83DRAFT_611184 [Colletotrichum acutatum]